MVRRLSWRDKARCRDLSITESDRFFSDDPETQRETSEDYCFKCPVRDLCLQSALDSKDIWGVWGGTTQDERRRTLGVDENGRADRELGNVTECAKCDKEDYRVLRHTSLGTEVQCLDCELTWETRAKIDMTL